MKLYHYTTIESFSKIWVSKQLKFSDSKNMNDLFERLKTYEIVRGILPTDEEKNLTEAFELLGKSFSDILAQYRQISFTLDYADIDGWASSMMWGQYAHNENGVCIEFDSNKILFPKNVYKEKVEYSSNVPTIRFDKEEVVLNDAYLQQFVKKNWKLLFFTKHKHWEHENEYRVVSNQSGLGYLSINDAITRVYVYDANNINTHIIEQLTNQEIPIFFLYITHLHGDRNIGCRSIKSVREIENNLEKMSDYYSNEERLHRDYKEFADIFGLRKGILL